MQSHASRSRSRGRTPAISRAGKKGPDNRDVEVGRRVRACRLEQGLSQSALANQLGLTFQQVQKYEKGTNRIGAGRLQKISEILKVPVVTFFAGAESAPQREESLFELVDTSAALRLLRAYRRLPTSKMKQALVQLAVEMAGEA